MVHNKACPSRASADGDAKYRKYRLRVVSILQNIRFLDATASSKALALELAALLVVVVLIVVVVMVVVAVVVLKPAIPPAFSKLRRALNWVPRPLAYHQCLFK